MLLYTAFHKKTWQWTYDNNRILTDFQNSFIVKFCDKFAVKLWLKVPTHLKCVAALPCEILMSENKRLSEKVLWLTINRKALQLGIWGYCGSFNKIYCKFTAESACRRIIRSVNIWLNYSQESWLPHALSVSGHCPAERWRTRQICWVWQETAVVNCCYIDFDLA